MIRPSHGVRSVIFLTEDIKSTLKQRVIDLLRRRSLYYSNSATSAQRPLETYSVSRQGTRQAGNESQRTGYACLATGYLRITIMEQ